MLELYYSCQENEPTKLLLLNFTVLRSCWVVKNSLHVLLLLNTGKATFCSVREDDLSLVILLKKQGGKEGRTNRLETERKGYIQ